jgi:hypothetical protein
MRNGERPRASWPAWYGAEVGGGCCDLPRENRQPRAGLSAAPLPVSRCGPRGYSPGPKRRQYGTAQTRGASRSTSRPRVTKDMGLRREALVGKRALRDVCAARAADGGAGRHAGRLPASAPAKSCLGTYVPQCCGSGRHQAGDSGGKPPPPFWPRRQLRARRHQPLDSAAWSE